MDERQLLYDLFCIMFLDKIREEYDTQVEDNEIYKIIDGSNEIPIKVLLLSALVDEYYCTNKFCSNG